MKRPLVTICQEGLGPYPYSKVLPLPRIGETVSYRCYKGKVTDIRYYEDYEEDYKEDSYISIVLEPIKEK